MRIFDTDFEDLGIEDYQIQWGELVDRYERLTLIICAVIVGFLVLDR